MTYENNQYLTASEVSFAGALLDTKKSKTVLQPIFECFTNALEAIKLKQDINKNHKGEITFKIHAMETTLQTTYFDSISIIDNGIGFNEEQFKRFNTFKDMSKGFKNLGSGRLQYVHSFETTSIKSTFEQDGKFWERAFVFSKAENFISNNAIVLHNFCKESASTQNETIVDFKNLLVENSDIYNNLNERTLKDKLIERYIPQFCSNRDNLPTIKIEFYVNSELKKVSNISKTDIPTEDKTKIIKLNYSRQSKFGIENSNKTEDFTINAFKIAKNLLKENKLNLVSKGEVIEEADVSLEGLASNDNIEGNKFLFLVSSVYIDERDTNIRGILNIPNKESFERGGDFFSNQEEIILEDIQTEINKVINIMYPEIEKVKKQHSDDFEKLKEMFLLDNETAMDINISINDTETDILKKFYEAEAKKEASVDGSIKESVDKVEKLDTKNPNYQNELKIAVDALVKTIPLQNKKTLTHYVARRKLVLELFQKILDNEKNKTYNGGRIDEDVLHNLIFQQSSNDPKNSDLWLINEEYIYFKGTSEGLLGKIELDGAKILKEQLSPEEQEYRTKQGGDARLRRTDILLFPAESKCIIIELKAPDINVSEHLNQINRYASLINNLSIDTLKFNTFYGYLIGESIDADDIIDNDSDYVNAPNLGYVFRPHKKINGKFGRADGSIYTEIIKYSTLLERAKLRNKIFIDKLTGL